MTRFSHTRSAMFRQLFSFLFGAFLLVGTSQAWATEKGVVGDAEGSAQVVKKPLPSLPPAKKLPVPPDAQNKPENTAKAPEKWAPQDRKVERTQSLGNLNVPVPEAQDDDNDNDGSIPPLKQAASLDETDFQEEIIKYNQFRQRMRGEKEATSAAHYVAKEPCYPPQDPDDAELFDICPVPNPQQFIAVPSRVLAYRPWDDKKQDYKVPSADEFITYAQKKANLVCKHQGLNDYYDYGLSASTPKLKIAYYRPDEKSPYKMVLPGDKNYPNDDDPASSETASPSGPVKPVYDPINLKRSLFSKTGTKVKAAEKWRPWHYEFHGKTWEYHIAKVQHRAKQVAKISSVASAGLIAVSAAIPPAAIVTAPLAGIAGATAGISAGLVKLMPHLEPMLKKSLRSSIDKANEKAKVNGARAYVLRKLGYLSKAKKPEEARKSYEDWKSGRTPVSSGWKSPQRPQGHYDYRPGGRRPFYDEDYSEEDGGEPGRPFEDFQNELENLGPPGQVPNKPKKDIEGDVEHLVFSQLSCRKYKKNTFLRFISRLRQKPPSTGQNVANRSEAIFNYARKHDLHRHVHDWQSGKPKKSHSTH